MKSVMEHTFSRVPNVEIPRSSFDRSHGRKSTFDAGYLVPIFVDEALPGDTFNLDMAGFARMATPLFPLMDNLKMETFFFAVPNRLVWDNWQKFCGEQANPGDSTEYVVPTITSTATYGYQNQSLEDYFGLPTGIPDLEHSALWHRAYNLIYNEWFRDQNLQDSVVVNTDDGPDSPLDYSLLKRGKRADYFTSSLPWPQKGESVKLPLGTQAAVKTPGTASTDYGSMSTDASKVMFAGVGAATGFDLYADLTDATAATINQLRQAFQVQKLLERDARGGSRYTEIVRSHFGVTSPDARLQRPEYLGGGSANINITPIAQTSSTDATTPQGNLAGYGTSAFGNHGFTKSFTEHCVIIGLICVRADLTYQQGLNRMWSRQTRLDYYWPALNALGEQAVLNKEIYAQGSLAATDEDVFGYQERYAEYRYKPSEITGKFRSNDAATLDSWHLSQRFTSLPTLNATFIQETPPMDRVVAVPSEPDFLFDAYFSMRCARPMPLYGVPGYIDHF